MTNTYFLKNKIRKLSKTFSRIKCFREYADIHRVLILFDLEQAEDVKDLAKSLTFAGKDVFAYTFNSLAKHEGLVLPANFTVLNKKNLTFSGFPVQQEMERYSSMNHDTLIDITIQPHPVLQYLSLKSDASFRVGFYREEKTFDDLLLEYDPEQGFCFLISQLHFYMKSLRAK